MKQSLKISITLSLALILPLAAFTALFHKPMYNPIFLEDSSSIDEFVSQLQTKIDSLLKTYTVPGVSIAIISKNNTNIITAGYSNFWKREEMSSNHLFQIASMSKTQCAFAIMKLLEEGLINLDVPVETYLTRWSLPESDFDNNEVTIRRILCHAAGLSLGGVPAHLSEEKTPIIEDALTEADVRVIYEPGSIYSYSGGGYAILQLVIEEVTGKSYEEYLQDEIFQPLGLSNTWADWNEGIDEGIAKGYGSMLLPIIKNYIAMKSAAGHYSSITDLVKWCNLFLQGQTLLNSTTISAMLTPQFGEDWGYTLGLNYKVLNNGSVVIGHGGDNWGYHGIYNFIINSKQGIVILTNGDRGAALRTEIMQKWEKLMGGSNLENLWEGEYREYRRIGLIEIIVSFVIITVQLIGFRYDFLNFNQKGIRSKLRRSKRILVNIIRWILSIGSGLGAVFLIIRWGWLNGAFTWRPTMFVFNIIISIQWLSWVTFAIHYISFQRKKKQEINN